MMVTLSFNEFKHGLKQIRLVCIACSHGSKKTISIQLVYKCHILVTTEKSKMTETMLKIERNIIYSAQNLIHLYFEAHIKGRQRLLHALARIINYIDLSKGKV